MPTTSKGFRYPSSTDDVRVYEDLQFLATDIDNYLTQPAMGQASSTSVFTTSSTSETVALTISGMVFKAGWAYKAEMRTAVYGTASALVFFRIRKTNASGTDWGEFGRVPCAGATTGSAAMTNGSIYLVRSAGTDLTTDVVLTTSTNTGTINHFASASSPRFLVIRPVGTATEYAGLGVDVT